MGGAPASDSGLTTADVVAGSIDVMVAPLAYPVRDWTSCPRNPRDLLDSLNQEQRTITNQTDLQNETFLLSIKDPNVRTSKKLT